MAHDRQFTAMKTIVESHPLSPRQLVMLRRSSSSPRAGVHIGQILCTLPRQVNVPALRQAWQRVLERHAILRTGFRVTHLKDLKAQQEVHRQVRLNFQQKDWRGLGKREQERRMHAYLQAEQRRGFELSVPPLMRLTLFHAGDAKHVLVWTFHRLLLERCVIRVLLNEVFGVYEAISQERDPDRPAPGSYRAYMEWLRKRDGSYAEAFWRQQLNDFTASAPLGGARAAGEARDGYARHGDADFPQDQCVHELFETQVERTPNAVALVYFKGEVSYRELDNQANRVALHLRSLRVGPDVPTLARQKKSLNSPLSIHSPFAKPTVVEFSLGIERRTAPIRSVLSRASFEHSRLLTLSSKAGAGMASPN